MIALLTIWSCAAGASDTAQWVLDKEGEQIALYTSEVEGSPFLAVKVTASIDAPIEKVLHVFGDGEGCSAWRAMCKSSQVIETVSEREHYIYMVLDLPWPISDRDLVVHSVVSSDTDSQFIRVDLNTSSDKHPITDDVRAESNGHYTLTATAKDVVEFVWVMHTDLKGKLSPGMINPQLTSATLKDVRSLIDLAEN